MPLRPLRPCLGGPCLGRPRLRPLPAGRPLPDRALRQRGFLKMGGLAGRPLSGLFKSFSKGDPGDLFLFWKQFSVGRPPLLKTPTPLEGESLPPKTPQMRGTPGSARLKMRFFSTQVTVLGGLSFSAFLIKTEPSLIPAKNTPNEGVKQDAASPRTKAAANPISNL